MEQRPARDEAAGDPAGSPPQQVLYATARALAEDWQYGAIWEVDRGWNVVRCVAAWHPAALPFDDFVTVSKDRHARC